MKIYIKTILRNLLNEAQVDANGNLIGFNFDVDDDDSSGEKLVNFDSFPPSVLKTLRDEYLVMLKRTFDWNTKQDELSREEFTKFLKKDESDKFLNNIDKLISMTTKDMILIKRQNIAKAKYNAFEELIKDAIPSEALGEALSKFEEAVLLDSNATIESIKAGFKEAKNIIDADGSINYDKITPSTLFAGGEINDANFAALARKNPEYKGIYNTWKKLFYDYIDLSLVDLNAYRDSTPIDKIRELRNFLINFKKTRM